MLWSCLLPYYKLFLKIWLKLLVISLICICIIYIRNTFDGLYGSGCIQKINYRYELFMTDSVRGFLIDNLSGKSIPIANPSFEGNIIYGECEIKLK